MKKINLFLLLALSLGVFLSSCATIFTKSTYPLSINCSPTAKITVTDKKGKEIYLGNTPAIVPLKAGAGFFSKAEYQVKFTAPGYAEKIIPVTFKIEGWYFGNILFGGIIGMLIVDPATGAMWKLENKFVNETLDPLTTSTPELKVYNINNIPEDWKSHLVAVK